MDLNWLGTAFAADIRTALISILAAFAMTHVLAATYVWSHRGLSYSVSFVQALVMAGVGAAMMMLAIGNNLVWGIGMVGALALVRFRTNLRDARDMIFIFVSLVMGISAGTHAYAFGVVGTILFCLIALYLSWVPFGLRSCFDALLRFTASDDTGSAAQDCLQNHCSSFVLATMQQVAQGEATEQVYQVRFRRENSRAALVRDLERIPGLSNLSLFFQESREQM